MSPRDDRVANDPEIAALIARAPLVAQLPQGAPLIVVAQAQRRVVFANEAIHAIFRTRDLEQINTALLEGTSPGARRLRELASATKADAPARLELLRFFIARLPVQLALHCVGAANAQGETFLIAATLAGVGETIPPPAKKEQPESPAPVAAGGISEVVATRRFLWSVNESLCFDAPAAELSETVGDCAPRPAESLDTLKARTGLDEDGAFAAALARQATFGSLRVAWPREAGPHPAKQAVVATLSGAPIFDRERRFCGYRGFGLLTGETTPFEGKPAAVEVPQNETAPLDELVTVADDAGVDVEENAAFVATNSAAPEGALPEAQNSDAMPSSPERTADIVPLRAPAAPYGGSPNFVPIRPGALPAFFSSEEGAPRGESVELTNHERDAFREIARALGAKIRDHRENRSEGAESEGAPDPRQEDNPPDGQVGDAPHAPGVVGEREPGLASDASALLDRLPIGALVTRGDEPLYLNRTLLDLLGYRDLEQFRAGSGLQRIFAGNQTVSGSASEEVGELTLIAANGETIAVSSQTQEIAWGGAPATLLSLRRSFGGESTPRLRAMEVDSRRRDSEAREVSAILDTATDGVVTLDAQARILTLNRPAEALFGFEQKEVAGESFLALFAPESREATKAYFDGLQTAGLASLLNEGREALGRERRGRAIPLFITLGRLAASTEAKFYVVLRDMTHWKTIERDLQEARGQAERANALKSEFLAKISHEIRTPLNAIIGFAEVIMEERFGPIGNERYKDYVKDIHASGAHVMSLINDLLDLSKIEAGKLDLNFGAVDANVVIQECVSLMQPQAAHERIIMRLSLFDKLPKIVADERSLRQIMLNLMSNAVKFNEPGGQVIVSTTMNDSGQAVIRVRDTGIGMSEAELGTALEPFRQVASSRQANGTGLGLPLTKALAEANRAGFSIKSRKEQGTLVEVAFPTVQAAAAQ
jgi:PAS domain S-box-containing protein